MDERRRSGRWARLKLLAGVVLVAFTMTLALVVGNRLSDEALGVLAGAVCGVGAAIPTSLLIVAVTRRREGGQVAPAPQPAAQQPMAPQIVVIPPSGGYQAGGWQGWGPALAPPQQRTFTVVGGNATGEGEVKDERYQ